MKVLVVDDAPSVVNVMTARLHKYGCDVFHAGNGLQAVELFAKVCPDLVLMDIEMPVMNGIEATDRIRAIEAKQQWAWTPIIFLTSSDTVENLVTAISAGGDDFLSKLTPEPVIEAKVKAMTRIAALRRRLTEANERLRTLADFDGLTGLYNRRSMDRKLDDLWAMAIPKRLAFGILMIDIDRFKNYNDVYGHLDGDDCLRAVAHAVDSATLAANASGTTASAYAARYGGEEFSVIVPDASDSALKDLSASVVQAVRGLALPHKENDPWGVVTVSVGAVRICRALGRLADLFRRADENLYFAKSSGRNFAHVSQM